MRQFFLILALLLPICAFSPLCKAFDGVGADSPLPFVSEEVSEGCVLINEVMANPNGSLFVEYVELYNPTEEPVSLEGMLVCVGTRQKSLPQVELPAGGYAVLHHVNSPLPGGDEMLTIAIEAFPKLNNEGQTIRLTTADGELIDEVTYAKARPGVSWERDASGLHLCYAEGGGTPGSQNSTAETKPEPEPEPEEPEQKPEPEEPEEMAVGSLWLNEIMADPNGSRYPEYIELHNRTDHALSLKGCVLWVGTRKKELPAATVPAGGYAVLYSSALTLTCATGAVKVPIESFLPLNNTGKDLHLKSATGQLIDEVTYAKAQPGVSWERDASGLHLCYAEGGGTPGSQNSTAETKPEPEPEEPEQEPEPEEPEEMAAGSLWLNEIMADPNGSRYPEYIELHNCTDRALSLEGCVLWVGTRKKELPAATVPAGGYAVLYSSALTLTCASGAVKVPIESFLPLNNTGKDLHLKSATGQLIDEVTYAKAQSGVSWERDASGLHLCYAEGGGTPGSQNSTAETKPEPEPEEPEQEPEPEEPEEMAAGSLWLNEIMADPNGSRYPEYIELHNRTDQALSLKGCVLWVGTRKKELPAAMVPAGGYAVLYSSVLTLTCATGAVKVPIESFLPLNNTGKDLHLKSATGQLIDEVTYAKAQSGVSWERDASGLHLCSAEGGGTPGSKNSTGEVKPEPGPEQDPEKPEQDPDQPEAMDIALGEILFSELLVDPYAGGSEYIELYNASDRPLTLTGLSLAIRKRDGSFDTSYPLTSVTEPLEPGRYVVLSKSAAGVEDFYLVKDADCLYELKLPVLANTASDLVLLQHQGQKLIDEVAYSVQWHASFVKNEKGVALERIRFDRPTQDPDNWTSAAESVGYGTPGYENSQHHSSGAQGEALGIEPPVFSVGTGDYTITYQFDQTGYSCRAYVFDTSGRRVAEIANHELMGSHGELRWNGQGSDGGKLTPGLYIFYVELYHPQGMAKRYKQIFLVH